MKKSTKILLNVCIILIFVCSLVSFALLTKDLAKYVNMRNFINKDFSAFDIIDGNISHEDYSRYHVLNSYNSSIESFNTLIAKNSVYVSLSALAAVSSVFVFVYCNPKLFRRSVCENFAEGWAQTKAERAKQKKQARIAKLQAELEELKKD